MIHVLYQKGILAWKGHFADTFIHRKVCVCACVRVCMCVRVCVHACVIDIVRMLKS